MNLETTTYRPNHNTFGGEVYQSDFCTEHKGARNIAERIISDLRFDEKCRRNILERERIRKKCLNTM